MPTKRKMTGWYDPVQLTRTGIRVAISTVFGQFADKREAFAATNAIADKPFDKSFDYTGEGRGGDFWFDFIADTGDGFKSTYGMASLLAESELQPRGATEPLRRGRLLVMGGDQVYPTASVEDYEDRLIYPFDEAYGLGGKEKWAETARPDLYALPGNHDWYDGLSAFFHLFCRRTVRVAGMAGVDRPGRVIGGRQTRQSRSYFALELPGNWWLWGTDSQLAGYIDQPQVDYFQYVAEQWMEPNAKLILCVGEPNWEYVDPKAPEKKLKTLSYLTRLAEVSKLARDKNHRLKLVLSGDSHHYARFLEGDLNYITCGGGGAFLHPTHHLEHRKDFVFAYPPPGIPYDRAKSPYPRSFTIAEKQDSGEEALYPTRSTSWWLTFGNFLFAVRNWMFPLVLFFAYLLFIWMLDFNARVFGSTTAGATLPAGGLARTLAPGSLFDAMVAYWELAFASPWPVVLGAAALGGYYYFADVENGWGRLLMGGVHFLAQAVVVAAITCFVIRAMGDFRIGWSIAAAAAASALASATVFGAYLWFSLAMLKRHFNEAFSSLRITGFKSFLRLKIDKNGELIVYPIGLRRLGDPTHLIESPIRIR